jgi:hypothetical protein
MLRVNIFRYFHGAARAKTANVFKNHPKESDVVVMHGDEGCSVALTTGTCPRIS